MERGGIPTLTLAKPEKKNALTNDMYGALADAFEPRFKGDDDKVGSEDAEPVPAAHLRKIFKGPIIAAGGFVRDTDFRRDAFAVVNLG